MREKLFGKCEQFARPSSIANRISGGGWIGKAIQSRAIRQIARRARRTNEHPRVGRLLAQPEANFRKCAQLRLVSYGSGGRFLDFAEPHFEHQQRPKSGDVIPPARAVLVEQLLDEIW